MSDWLNGGKIIFRKDTIDDLKNSPQAFIGLLAGENFGSLIVRVT